MADKKHRRPQSGVPLKLDEFPEDFDDLFFHNLTVDSQQKIGILRSIVYKTIKNQIYDRIKSYKDDNIPLEDKFEVSFKTEGYTEFQWAVVRDELLHCGYDPKSVFNDENKLVELIVSIERTINLTKTLEERMREEREFLESESECESEECE
jgi:hypothetical protein